MMKFYAFQVPFLKSRILTSLVFDQKYRPMITTTVFLEFTLISFRFLALVLCLESDFSHDTNKNYGTIKKTIVQYRKL